MFTKTVREISTPIPGKPGVNYEIVIAYSFFGLKLYSKICDAHLLGRV